MSSISGIGSNLAAIYGRSAAPAATPARVPGAAGDLPVAKPNGESFASVFGQVVGSVDAKQAEANAVTKQVLLGNSGQLHQSVIAMQEASVAFSLMVEVRNKLVDSYQELMRMPV